jgi:peptide/nickel transport system ATP-binding protein
MATSAVQATQQLLEIRDLQTYFYLHEGTVRAVDGVSFDVCCGRTLGVIGESGCGKSVTAQSILRLVPEPPGRIVAGHIWLYPPETDAGPGTAVDIAALDSTGDDMRAIRWKEIAMIFQEPMTSFSPIHTVGDQITEAMLIHMPQMSRQEARDRAIELLDSVGIPKADQLVDAYSYQLSGGMRQRAMIAMALACQPQVVIADEPTTALDVMVQAQILELLDTLRHNLGLSVILVTHDLGVVAEVCDSVQVMYGGVTAEYASVDTIYNQPQHPYTRQLLDAFPDLSNPQSRLKAIPGYPPRLDNLPPGCRFAPRCEVAFERCSHEKPALHRLGEFHQASCHLVEQ